MDPIRAREILKGTALGGLAGFLVLGLGGRLLMRLIALAAGGETGFSWGGTLEVAAFGGLVGLFAGVFHTLFLKGRLKAWWWEGLALGLLSYAAILLIPIEGKGAIEMVPEAGRIPAAAAFLVLFLLFGLAAARLTQARARN